MGRKRRERALECIYAIASRAEHVHAMCVCVFACVPGQAPARLYVLD